MDDLEKLEQNVQRQYDEVLQPLAKQLAVDLTRGPKDAPRLPMVLFLGNHSSGKSSFINYLIGSERQKTGLAPTDDGFTVLVYGENQDELDGQSVVSHPTLSLGRLEKLGPAFLSRLRLKIHPAEILKSLSLVDSPGMIDAAATPEGRSYDFAASVREFAEMADLILFFFDPDKPGTTGETVSIFNQKLAGMEHKLLIVLNKVDLFSNIRDFARTYGTLCWNLSKTMRTKDVPHIFNTYLPALNPQNKEQVDERLPLGDFDQSREEVVTEIRRAPTRRADNLVSELLQEARRLAMQARVGEAVSDFFRHRGLKINAMAAILFIAGAGGAALTRDATNWMLPVGWAVAGLAVSLGLLFGGRVYLRREGERLKSPTSLDPFFEDVYRKELSWQERTDLRALWQQVRPKLLNSMDLKNVEGLPHGLMFRRRLRRVDQVIDQEVPKLRRSLKK